MQGEPAPEENDQTFYDYIKDTVYKSLPPQDFLNINIVSLPHRRLELKERVETNFEKYKGNYIILLAFFTLVFITLNPEMIFLILLWAIYFFSFKPEESSCNLRGFVVKKMWVFRACAVISLVYVLFFYNVIFAMLATVSFFIILVLSHMLLFYEKDVEEEDV